MAKDRRLKYENNEKDEKRKKEFFNKVKRIKTKLRKANPDWTEDKIHCVAMRIAHGRWQKMFDLLWWEWAAIITSIPIGVYYIYWVEKVRLNKEMEEFKKEMRKWVGVYGAEDRWKKKAYVKHVLTEKDQVCLKEERNGACGVENLLKQKDSTRSIAVINAVRMQIYIWKQKIRDWRITEEQPENQ